MVDHKWYSVIDFNLLINALFICCAGLLVVFSVNPSKLWAAFFHIGISLVLMYWAASQPINTLQKIALKLYLVALVLLIAVFFVGDVSKGARRWLNFGFFRLQPSELMKSSIPLLLSSIFSQKEGWNDARTYVTAAIALMVPVMLVLRQPDLGTALLIFSSGFCVLVLVGLNWKVLVLGAVALVSIYPFLCGVPLPSIISQPLLHPYQCKRVITFLDPYADPFGSGYHTIQATIAIGSGGFWGEGWLHGTQSHLDFIPESHTDFAFAVFAEEFGFFGSAILILLYVNLILRSFWIACGAQSVFSRLLAGSLACTFLIYVSVNIGMVTGLLPVVGVPLPYVSYGGSSMMTLFFSLGLLMSIHRQRHLVSV
ncbi:rod shape-determining protein RodA [Candidatus Ichthyocystis hellenicum]|uniref:rod shape-determining protein RodA n=1 Tax=Candidatus Ichthyocystis hellenicum TaxID=1561003 RepID=UPI000A5B6F63|nr:rod shape-determining protein RodA [Candidatus Ichthyocystis hellenicum]